MRDISERGRSLVNTIGLLMLVAVLTALGTFLATVLWHQAKINEVSQFMGEFFQKYQDNAPDLFRQKANLNGPTFLKNYGLVDQCDEAVSMFDRQKTVCRLPLGEFDLTTTIENPNMYALVSVHFNDMYKRQSCEQFLRIGWEKVLPASFFGQNGYIGTAAENEAGKMYYSNNQKFIDSEGAQRAPTENHLKAVCKICRKSRYCTIQFSLELSEKSLGKVTFPAELTGDDEKSEEDNEAEAEVTKEGDTYTKTMGGYTEYVTYNSNGTFSGSTYSGGSLGVTYNGTYNSQGITSYTSYKDAGKTDISKKIDNITYDQKGNIQSYEKGSQKIVLIGNADDCLMMDSKNNAKQFGHCAELFQNEVSLLSLNYDENGRLSEVSTDGAETNSYTFIYDAAGKLSRYCEATTKECYTVPEGKTIKDIIKQDIPETLGKFDKIYNTIEEKTSKPRRRIYTYEEALERVKDEGNTVKIMFK